MRNGTHIGPSHYQVLFRVRRSILYHKRLREHYDRLHGWMPFFIIPAAARIFRNKKRKRLHAYLVRKFTKLERRLVSPDGKNPAVIAKVYDKILKIEADEPSVLHVLNTLCRNELMRAEGFPEEQQISVKLLPRLFACFVDLGALSPPSRTA